MIIIEAGILARAMKSAARVVESRNTIPILSNVRLIANGDTLEVTTTNLDIEFRQTLPLAQAGELQTTVDAQRLTDLANAAPDGAQITLDLQDGRMVVKAGRSRWQVPVLPAQDFPGLPFADVGGVVEVPGKALSAAIKRVLWAASNEVTRYYLCGFLLNVEQGRLRLTATNGHVMVATPLDVAWPADAPEVIVPTKFARLVEAMASDSDHRISVSWDDRMMRIVIGEGVLTGKLIEGSFPDYRRIIPPEDEARFCVDPAALSAAIRRVQIVTGVSGDDKVKSIRISREADRIALHGDNIDGSAGSDEVPAECAAGITAGFSCQYLAEMLERIGGDTIEFHQAEAGSPAMVRRSVGDGALGVISPRRI